MPSSPTTACRSRPAPRRRSNSGSCAPPFPEQPCRRPTIRSTTSNCLQPTSRSCTVASDSSPRHSAGSTRTGATTTTPSSGVGSGINADATHRPPHPLAVIHARDLEGTRSRVIAAGGEITREIFAFPGGRRFHFRDPAGNELAVWSKD
ncbi:MAG: VOC family protein [Dokdonella sp.]|uniref:VOC family protein n=1 Tax=Dokdonella sp. TaxID=2291710 RepID=UPI003F7E6A1F